MDGDNSKDNNNGCDNNINIITTNLILIVIMMLVRLDATIIVKIMILLVFRIMSR